MLYQVHLKFICKLYKSSDLPMCSLHFTVHFYIFICTFNILSKRHFCLINLSNGSVSFSTCHVIDFGQVFKRRDKYAKAQWRFNIDVSLKFSIVNILSEKKCFFAYAIDLVWQLFSAHLRGNWQVCFHQN